MDLLTDRAIACKRLEKKRRERKRKQKKTREEKKIPYPNRVLGLN
jgi:hypothetical protein